LSYCTRHNMKISIKICKSMRNRYFFYLFIISDSTFSKPFLGLLRIGLILFWDQKTIEKNLCSHSLRVCERLEIFLVFPAFCELFVNW